MIGSRRRGRARRPASAPAWRSARSSAARLERPAAVVAVDAGIAGGRRREQVERRRGAREKESNVQLAGEREHGAGGLLGALVVGVVGDVLAEALLAAALRDGSPWCRRSKPVETVCASPSSA